MIKSKLIRPSYALKTNNKPLGWDDDKDLFLIGPRIPEYKPKRKGKA